MAPMAPVVVTISGATFHLLLRMSFSRVHIWFLFLLFFQVEAIVVVCEFYKLDGDFLYWIVE
jgi:hypothetical protein